MSLCDMSWDVPVRVALFHVLFRHPWLLQSRFAPPFDGLLCHGLGCLLSRCLTFPLGPHFPFRFLKLPPKQPTLP